MHIQREQLRVLRADAVDQTRGREFGGLVRAPRRDAGTVDQPRGDVDHRALSMRCTVGQERLTRVWCTEDVGLVNTPPLCRGDGRYGVSGGQKACVVDEDVDWSVGRVDGCECFVDAGLGSHVAGVNVDGDSGAFGFDVELGGFESGSCSAEEDDGGRAGLGEGEGDCFSDGAAAAGDYNGLASS